ncbi:hypothetical protein [Roseovarius sp.]|uniref:hypothetical protein n=1 Tax=Roseovarius sp. TaxID=1486281 RepID=UPI000C40E1C2|nr:hypothetical protein [Roseovarius sp.]MAZ20243.1 hypothetical protein [Roseovarius sp.]
MGAASAEVGVDYGGNLDKLALDVFAQVQSGALSQNEAIAEIKARAISYDGKMNLTVGTAGVALAGVGCALAGGGTVCAAAGGALALVAESNTIYDGLVTVITGEETDGYIKTAFEAAGYSEENAAEYERLVELGLAVATVSVETGVITLSTKSGQVLRTVKSTTPPSGPAQSRDELGSPSAGSVPDAGQGLDDAPNRTGDTVEVFEPGANISPNSTLDLYPSIGRDGTFVTEVGSIERVTGPIPEGATEIRITRQQADQLETDLGLNPGSLESSNTLSIVSDVQGRCPRCPVSGNDHFLGGGKGLPGGGSELIIDSIPSAGGDGIRQITVIIE